MSFVKFDENLYYGIHPSVVYPDIKIDRFIDLTEEDEMPKFDPKGAIVKSFKIKDRNAPSIGLLKEIVDYIENIPKNENVYIFCKGGHGRSGVIAASVYGKLHHLSGKESLKYINNEWEKQRDLSKLSPKIRNLGSPQTSIQKKTVIEYLDNINGKVKKHTKNNSVAISTLLFYEPTDPYYFFSNFYTEKTPLIIDDEKWYNTEQYFQAMKFRGKKASTRSIEYSNIIKNADSPMKVKLLGTQKTIGGYGAKWKINKNSDNRLVNDIVKEYKDIKIRNDWKIASISCMIKAVYCKFTQYDNLKKEIIKIPDNTYLVEHTTRDSIWGDGGDGGDGTIGTNQLGKILTAVVYVIKYGDCSKMTKELSDKIKILL